MLNFELNTESWAFPHRSDNGSKDMNQEDFFKLCIKSVAPLIREEERALLPGMSNEEIGAGAPALGINNVVSLEASPSACGNVTFSGAEQNMIMTVGIESRTAHLMRIQAGPFASHFS